MASPPPAFEHSTQELLDMSGTLQSNLQVPASQPFSDAFRHRAIQRRRSGTNVQLPRNTYLDIGASQVATRENYQVLRDQVFSEVKARLADVNIRIEDMSPLLFSFLLPGMGANINAWNTLINRPIFLPPDTLRNMLSLTESATTLTNPNPDTTVFYCRTFSFFLDEFTYLLQLLFEEYQQGCPEQLFAWIRMIAHLDDEKDRSTMIYLRYIGQTTVTAWGRYHYDLSLNISSGLNRTFLQICQNEFPEVLAACEVEEFDKATIEIPLRHSQRRVADVREQGLIALFGPLTLLNTSVGGMEAVFEQNNGDMKEFVDLNTRTIEKLDWYTSPMVRLDELQAYGRSVQRYTSRNTASTNSIAYPITDEVRDRLVNDSIPVLCQDRAILVTMGSDLGPGSYQLKQPFYSGAARSSALACDVFKSLVNAELGYSTTVQHRIPLLQQQRFLPFIDLFPWAKKSMEDLDNAMRLARKYLQATSPMVILAFSELVTGVALSNFQSKEGTPRGTSIHQISGSLHLSKFDNDPGASESENCCIVIPCIHPGALAHSNSAIGLRLFAKTLAIAWLSMHTAISVLQENSELDKKSMCERIMSTMNRRIGSGTPFGITLENLRQQYLRDVSNSRERRLAATDLKFQRQISRAQAVADTTNEKNLLVAADIAQSSSLSRVQWQEQTPQLPAAISRCKKALEQIHMIVNCDIASGNSTSKERKDQVDRLLNVYSQRLNTRSLSQKDFIRKLTDVKPGNLYYFAMTGIAEQRADLAHLLTFFTDDNVAAGNARDEAAAKASVVSLKAFISKNIVTGNKRRQDSRSNIAFAFQEMLKTRHRELSEVVHRLRRAEPLKLTTFQKSPHKVIIQTAQDRKLGLLQFRWLHEGQETTLKDFPIPMGATPIFPGEDRYIAFVKEGVDIRDTRGRSLGTAHHRPVTLPLDQLVTRLADNPLSDKFLKLWERENNTTVAESLDGGPPQDRDGTEATTVFAYPKTFFSGMGRGLPLNAAGKTEDAKANSIRTTCFPFQPADAGWLINRFLIAKYPNGGEIDLCSPDVWPESRSAWSELRGFLEDPLWTHHPQRQNLISACSAIKLVGMSGQGPGRKGDGPKVIRGLSRLVRVLRPPMSERARESKNGPLGGRRTKTVLTAGSTTSLPVGAIANIPDPELESILQVTTTRELNANDPALEDVEDEAEVEGDFELTTAELAEQDRLFAQFDTMKHQVVPSINVVEASTEMTTTGVSQISTKRKRDDTDPPIRTMKTSSRKFGYVRRMAPRNALLMWGNKYGWDPDQVDDEEDVEVDVEVGGDEDSDCETNVAKKHKGVAKTRGNDPDSDEEMLIRD